MFLLRLAFFLKSTILITKNLNKKLNKLELIQYDIEQNVF